MVEVLAPQALTVEPTFCRVELATGAITTITFDLRLAEPAQLLVAESDCGCVRTNMPADLRLPAGISALKAQITGVLPGMKTVTVRTTAGSATMTIQVVTPGLGDGAAVAADVRRQAAAARQRIVIIVHDLKGETRNCGCSGGSLGGIDHLGALREVFPGARLILSGTIESGATAVVGPALTAYGWESAPADVVVTNEPLAALEQPGLLAIINSGGQVVANQRMVTPLLDRGALATVLLITANGTIASRHLLPIDRSLPSVPALLAIAATARPIVIDATQQPSVVCASCHQAAHATWSGSAHARAFASLLPADRSTDCAICHSTPLAQTTMRAADVGCTACHQGSAAHALQPTVRTVGAIDCRTCHDAQHHPAFDPVAAWLRIQHDK